MAACRPCDYVCSMVRRVGTGIYNRLPECPGQIKRIGEAIVHTGVFSPTGAIIVGGGVAVCTMIPTVGVVGLALSALVALDHKAAGTPEDTVLRDRSLISVGYTAGAVASGGPAAGAIGLISLYAGGRIIDVATALHEE